MYLFDIYFTHTIYTLIYTFITHLNSMLNIFNHGIVPIEAPPLNSPTDDMKIDENNDDILENKDHNLENSDLNSFHTPQI